MTAEPAAAPRRMVFISYSRADSDDAWQLANDLKEKDIPVWIDQEGIRMGERFDDLIEAAIDGCTHLLVLLTPESVQSRYVKDETYYALDEGKRVIPVLLRHCRIPFRLRRLHRADFTVSRAAGLSALVPAIRDDRDDALPKPSLFWRVYTPFRAAFTSLTAIVLALAFFLPSSRTSVALADSGDPNRLKIEVRNQGWRPSTIIGGYRLKFGDLPVEDESLAPADPKARAFVLPQWTRDVFLMRPPQQFDTKKRDDGSHPSRQEVDPLIHDQPVTLEVEIAESDDPAPGRKHHVATTIFSIRRIWPFVRAGLPDIFLGGAYVP